MNLLPIELLTMVTVGYPITKVRLISKRFCIAYENIFMDHICIRVTDLCKYVKNNHHDIGLLWGNDFTIYNHLGVSIQELSIHRHFLLMDPMRNWMLSYFNLIDVLDIVDIDDFDLYTIFRLYKEKCCNIIFCKQHAIDHLIKIYNKRDKMITCQLLMGNAQCLFLRPRLKQVSQLSIVNVDLFNKQLYEEILEVIQNWN